MLNRDLGYSDEYKNRWLVSYADFVTLLLALFMVLYALSQIDISNLRDFTNSVDNVFLTVSRSFYQKKMKMKSLKRKKSF